MLYPVINQNGKEYEKEFIYMCVYIYVYITESLCGTAEVSVVNQLYFNRIHFLKKKNRCKKS